MKKLLTALVILLVPAALMGATILSDAWKNECYRRIGSVEVCRILTDLETNLEGTTSSTGAYDIGFDGAGGFSGATVGAALTELTSTTGAGTAGSQIIGVDQTGVVAVFDDCVNVEECLIELGGTGAAEGSSIIGVTAALTALYDSATDVDGCLTQLTETDAGSGSDIIGYVDSGSLTAAATVDAALDQVYGVVNRIFIPPYAFRECNTSAGDVEDAPSAAGATEGSGGVLASDTTPRLVGIGATTAQAIEWITTGEHIICATVMLPPNFSGDSNVTINVYAAADVADADNTEEFDIITNWLVSGSAPGADNAAVTTAALQATDTNIQALAATVLAANVPAAPIALSLQMNPDQNTNNNIYMFGVEIVFIAE